MKLEELRVMIVDDNPKAAQLVALVLKGIGVQRIVEAKDGYAAQEILAADAEAIDLVICDNQMPGMSGLELLQSVRRSHSALPFLMVTGNADPAFVEAAERHGISGYIQKPFTPQKLQTTLSALIQGL